MPNEFAHFSICADEPERAKRFYGEVFGWSFRPWGPPEFWMIDLGQAGVSGALQRRRGPKGEGGDGFEITFAVSDLAAAIAKIEASGGTITMPQFVLEGVGTMAGFADTEGNRATVMQYDEGVRPGPPDAKP